MPGIELIIDGRLPRSALHTDGGKRANACAAGTSYVSALRCISAGNDMGRLGTDFEAPTSFIRARCLQALIAAWALGWGAN